jgi:Holliday junction resolvase
MRMKRIDRDPGRFEVISLFEAMARSRGLKLTDKESSAAFVEQLSQSFNSSKSYPTVLHGRRVESMFEYVAASLGKCTLIKREDAGEVCSTDTRIQPPDFRLVLDGGRQLFIEVKNCHRPDPNHRVSLTAAYLDSLNRYARIFGCELLVAIFWSRWKNWTLVRPEDFVRPDGSSSICLLEAMQVNRMEMLGDVMVGTTPPLALRIVADPHRPRRVDDSGRGICTIESIEFYCNGQRIADRYERELTFYFMLNSDWGTDGPHAEIVDNELVYIEYLSKPEEAVPNQNFQYLGFLSSMISRHYNGLTTVDGAVVRLSPVADPGALGILIPSEYKGEQLPLWRLQCQSSRHADVKTVN